MKLTPQQKNEFIREGIITDIHGDKFMRAKGRILLFREEYPNWAIRTSIINEREEFIVMKAEILDDKGMVKADGIRSQRAGESYREKCQTCAVSRALANLGIGIEFGVASAEEMFDYWNSPEGKKKLAEKEKRNKKVSISFKESKPVVKKVIKKVVKNLEAKKSLTEDEEYQVAQYIYKNKEGKIRPAEEQQTLLNQSQSKYTEYSYNNIVDKLKEIKKLHTEGFTE